MGLALPGNPDPHTSPTSATLGTVPLILLFSFNCAVFNFNEEPHPLSCLVLSFSRYILINSYLFPAYIPTVTVKRLPHDAPSRLPLREQEIACEQLGCKGHEERSGYGGLYFAF